MLHLAVTFVLLFQYSVHGQFLHYVEGDIRLVNSRLEIFYNFIWGTVCDDFFGDINAQVACKQLGYSTGVSLGSDVDDGSGRIWLDNVNCAGNEQKLMYCSHEKWGVGNCNHNEDVGIYCFNKTTVLGGWSPWTTWSVCSDYGCNDGLQSRSRRCDWPLPSDKSFYCKGTSMEIKSFNSTLYPGSRSITQSDLEGNYSLGAVVGVGVGCIIVTIILVLLSQYAFLHLRKYKGGDTRNSNTAMLSISVIGFAVLSGLIQAQYYGDIRLVGRRLEIYYLEEWGTVCDDRFGDNDAKVACKELGYSTGISLGNNVDDGDGMIWQDEVNCTGFESKLTDCLHAGWSEEDCTHPEGVGLTYNIYPVQGNWSSWTSICNATYSGDLQSRSRKCNDPLPSEYDLYCNGSSMETKMCNTTSTLGSVEKTDNEKRYSAGVVAGVAIGCIIITIVLMLLGLYAVLRLRIYKQSANQSSKPEESYDDLKINQTTGVYSVDTNQNNTQTVISKTNNRQSNVPGDTYDNLGQDFYENISQK